MYIRMAIVKKRKRISVGKEVEKLESLCISGGTLTRAATLEDSMAVPQKCKQRITI